MLGLMQDRPLTLPHVFHRAEQLFGHKTVVTAATDGETTTTVAELCGRVRRLATVLDALGVGADGRVGTFGWNTARHLELYLAAPCTGRVLHTLNIRLFPEQLVYIANHAEDEVVFVDRSLLPLLVPLADKLETVRTLRRDRRRRRRRDPGRPAGARLRGAAGRGRAAHRHVRGRGRELGRRDVLHVRHHRQPQGRRLQPPLGRAALAGVADRRRPGAARAWTSCCRSCRCSTPTRGACPTARCWPARRWSCPGPNMTPEAIASTARGRHRVTVTAGVPTIWMGVLPLAATSTTCPRCGRSSAAARRCRGRCRRPTGRRSACRSCRRGA